MWHVHVLWLCLLWLCLQVCLVAHAAKAERRSEALAPDAGVDTDGVRDLQPHVVRATGSRPGRRHGLQAPRDGAAGGMSWWHSRVAGVAW